MKYTFIISIALLWVQRPTVLFAQSIVWEKVFISSGDQSFNAVEKLGPDIYAVGTFSPNLGQLLKLDSQGNELWRKSIRLQNLSNSNVYGMHEGL